MSNEKSKSNNWRNVESENERSLNEKKKKMASAKKASMKI
jgi:hypothetical protein